MAGATVMGTLRMHSLEVDHARRLAAFASSCHEAHELSKPTTREDGGFVASGLDAGEIEIRPVLPPRSDDHL